MVTSRSLEETGSIYDVGKNGGLHKSPTSREICEMHVAEPRAQDSCRGVYHLLTGEGMLSPPLPCDCGRGFRLDFVM